MEPANIDGITLQYEVTGSGAPVVFIHGVFIADPFRPLLVEPSLADRYRLIAYHRRGYAGSSPVAGPVSVARQAADCRALLQHLGVERAHVVGHSFGGCIALQLALDSPEVVHSLALLEPALTLGASAESYREALTRSTQRYREVGAATVVDEGIRARWPEYREKLDRVLPGAFEQAVADAAATFDQDTAGWLQGFCFGAEEARRVTQPVLSVLGGKSEALWPRFGEVHRLLLAWIPSAEGFVLPGTTHFLHLEGPSASAGLAEALADFFGRHPL